MIENKYRYLSCDKICPQGWTNEKLEKLADGLTGNLEELWSEVGPENGWLGGNENSWERGPYYIDGLVPLSLLLKNEKLEERALKWVGASIRFQRKDGFFGPCANDDWWPRMIMLKALIEYADARPDTEIYFQIVSLISRFYHFMDSMLDEKPLTMWAYARGMEAFVSLKWIYEKTKDGFYNNLAIRIMKSSFPWDEKFYANFPFQKPIGEYLPWAEYSEITKKYRKDPNQGTYIEKEKFERYFDLYHLSHGVNVAMSVKYLVYQYQITGDCKYLDTLNKGIRQLYHYHGQPSGMFSCDEHLNGINPSQGTELCTVVELMYSLEEIISITGDLSYGDWLERITYNALMTTISQDCCSHQYNQQVNQISCTVDKRNWYNNWDDSNTFGLVPYFGCCTANMHQGWPKFAQSLWMKNGDGYVCLSYAPVSFSDDGVDVTVESDYPFKPEALIRIRTGQKDREFTIKLRVPSWARSVYVTLNGKEMPVTVNNHCIELIRKWNDDDIRISFKFYVQVQKQNTGLAVFWGPILFAYPIAAKKSVLNERGRFSDYEFRPIATWNYGMKESQEWKLSFRNGIPELDGVLYQVKNWKEELNSAGTFPKNPEIGDSIKAKLVPYGLTVLRIADFPILA